MLIQTSMRLDPLHNPSVEKRQPIRRSNPESPFDDRARDVNVRADLDSMTSCAPYQSLFDKFFGGSTFPASPLIFFAPVLVTCHLSLSPIFNRS